eukprot:jgi/Botrbrau1/9922/Bobra.0012s0021.1
MRGIPWRSLGLSSFASIYAASLASSQSIEAFCDAAVQLSTVVEPVPGAELRIVQAVFRHGARTPLTDKYWQGVTWEKGLDCGQLENTLKLNLTDLLGGPQPFCAHDDKQAKTFYPGGCSKGELTLLGQKQAQDLGHWLQQRYINLAHFLPPEYHAGDVEGRSTNYRRTIATLRGVLTGLYPNASEPVPVTVAEDTDEVLFGNTEACRRLGSMLKVMQNRLREEGAKEPRLQKLQERLRSVLGLEDDHRLAFVDLFDALTCLAAHGKPLPAGVTPDLMAEVNREATRRMASLVAPVKGPHEEALRLSMGLLFEQIIRKMEAAKTNDRPLLVLYSGHDTTIMPLLATLGLDLEWWPYYTSNIVFELWQESPPRGRYLVRVLHDRKPVTLGPKQVPYMTLEEFEETFFKPYMLTREQYHTECAVAFDHSESTPVPEPAQASGSAIQDA